MHMSRANAAPKPSFDELSNRWLDELSVSESTQRSYRLELGRLRRWSALEGLTPAELGHAHVGRFAAMISSARKSELAMLGISKPLLSSSLDQARRIVCAWLRWAVAGGWVPADALLPTAWPEVTRIPTEPRPLSTPALRKATLGISPSESATADQARQAFVTGLAFWLGLGPAEISALQTVDVRSRSGAIRVRLSRGRKGPASWQYGPTSLLRAWKTYQAAKTPSSFAVSSAGGSKVTAGTVARIIRSASPTRGRHAESDAMSATRLRQAFIDQALDHGWSSDELLQHLRRQRIHALADLKRTPTALADKLSDMQSALSQ